jgi:hypothetical protein
MSETRYHDRIVTGAKTEADKRDEQFEQTPEFQRFERVMGKLLKVSKKELDERMAEYAKNSTRKRVAKKQRKPS